MLKRVWRGIAAGCIAVACLGLVVAMFVAFLSDKDAADRDFIEYWAAGQQLVHGADPYDHAAIFALQQHAGLKEDRPKITFSPPPLLVITLPLGFVTPKTGLIFFLLIVVGGLMASIWLIWALFGRPDSGLQLCGFVFAPAAACLMAGQLGIFLLLGVTLFLYLEERLPYLAGAALLPCAWKPHLFTPFFVVLLLWCVGRKRYQSLVGLVLMLALSCATITLVDGSVWLEYSRMMKETGVLHAFVPTLSVTLRFLIAPHAVWLQFVPELAACIWAAWYFWTWRDRWSWLDHGLLVLLVGFVCTPYGWFSDEAVLLIPVLGGVFRASETGRSLVPVALIAGLALVEITLLGHMSRAYYLWTPAAWMAWYLYATWGDSPRPANGSRVKDVASFG